jgi:hypothetical protein
MAEPGNNLSILRDDSLRMSKDLPEITKQLTFDELADFFLQNYSKPPIRAPTTRGK